VREIKYSNPFIFFILTLPYGISAGFVSVTLPYFLTQNGFTVGVAASITALGLSANLWRFAWAPLTDLTLSLHKWYGIGIVFCSVTLLMLSVIPLHTGSTLILTIIVLLSQVAATFVMAPLGGFMAKTIEEGKKGRAAGWFQAGNLGGMGIGGGAGIWLATQFSYQLSVIIVSITMLLCALGLYYVPQVVADKTSSVKEGFIKMFANIKEMFRSRVALYTVLLIMTPISAGAAAYVWSSVADDWKVNADTVALVTGVLSGLVSAVGCIAGGWAADKVGMWWSYFGGGILMAAVTLVMAVSGFNPFTYVAGVLAYAFMIGFAYAAFSAVLLHAIGKGLASTKYALLSSLGNIGPVFMTSLDGWMHDQYGIKGMLFGESIIGVVFVIIFLLALYKFKIAGQTSQVSSDLIGLQRT
jgi:PAT family beta-lactamase induction signal transducer AmpG